MFNFRSLFNPGQPDFRQDYFRSRASEGRRRKRARTRRIFRHVRGLRRGQSDYLFKPKRKRHLRRHR